MNHPKYLKINKLSFKNLILIVIACFSLACYSQTNITGVITNPEEIKWVVLHQYQGVKSEAIAKSPVSEMGAFTLSLPDSIPTGMYRLVYNLRENKYVDIIYAQNNINMAFNVFNPLKTLTFTNSPENTQYYNAFGSILNYENQLRVLNDFVQRYNKQDNEQLYKLAIQEYINNVQAINNVYHKAKINYSKLSCEYLLAQKKYYPNPKDDFLLQNYYSKQHLLDYLNPTNEYLLQSPILNDIIVGNIGQLRNAESTTIQDYINVVDLILNWSAPNQVLNKEITSFLADGFKMLDLPEVIEHIDVNYKANQCEADSDTDLQKRLKAYERLAIGKQAPEISWIDNDGQAQLLSKQTKDYTVVIFWASWCGSCKTILPSVNEYLNSRADVFALAVGLDDNKEDWLHEQTHYPNFNHIQAKEKWNSKTATDYAIFATPTFYVLDKDKKIIGKAKNVVELKTLF